MSKVFGVEVKTQIFKYGHHTATMVPMKLGWCSGTSPLADGIIVIGYPDASANSMNAFWAFATRSLQPATMTGFTALFRNLAVSSTAASRPNGLLELQEM
ncbi:hypothetical protein LXL04_010312 [Taraxacum kok-saghyz]